MLRILSLKARLVFTVVAATNRICKVLRADCFGSVILALVGPNILAMSFIVVIISSVDFASASDSTLLVNRNTGGGVGANARRIVLNDRLYPASSFYVPNSFVSNGEHRYYAFLHGISRVRNTRLKKGCEPDCSDAIAYAEFDVWKKDDLSLTLQYSVHSLSGRNGGTSVGEGQSLGFKIARTINESSAFSFSGEHIAQLDDTVDLGRNYFLGYSKFVKRALVDWLPGQGYIFNVGLGSGLYTVYENELFNTKNLATGPYFSDDKDVFTGGKKDRLRWGLIGSASYIFSDRIAVGAEFIGFGLGFGVSLKPFPSLPLTVTGYFYDLIDNVPHGIPCAEDPCLPRLYGRMSYSF